MEKRRFLDTKSLTLLGILSAIVILQNFVPFLGLIPIQPFNPTIIHITIIVASIVLGIKEGVILGLVWGVMCIIRAYVAPTSIADFVFYNPFVSVLPRVLVGLFSGLCYKALQKSKLNSIVLQAISGVIGSFTNTIFVLGMIYLLYKESYSAAYEMTVQQLLPAIIGVIGTNGIPEAIVAAILVPAISTPLIKIFRK